MDSVVEGIRPFDGKSYSYMIEQLKELLQSPDISDGDSEARRRLEELMRAFRPLYALKARHCRSDGAVLLAVTPCHWPTLCRRVLPTGSSVGGLKHAHASARPCCLRIGTSEKFTEMTGKLSS